MTRRPSRSLPLILLLLLVNTAFGAVIFAELTRPDLFVRRMGASGTEAPQNSAPQLRSQEDPGVAMPGEAAFAVITQRPLFSPDRRPPQESAGGSATPVSDKLPPLLLTGVVIADDDSVAIVEDGAPGRQNEPGQVVRLGDSIQGWTVEEILPDRIVLTRGEDREELRLVEDGAQRQRVQRRRAPVGQPGQARTQQGTTQQRGVFRPRAVQPQPAEEGQETQ